MCVDQTEIIKINRYNSEELYEFIPLYILLKTGSPLTPSSISNGLLECFGVKTSHITVKNKLDELEESGHILKLEREYIKPHFRKNAGDQSLDFGNMYYVNADSEQIDHLYSGLRSIYKKNKTLPTKSILKKRIALARKFASMYPKVKNGVIVYYYTTPKGVVKKKYEQLDFMFDTEAGKSVVIVRNSNNLFSSQKGNSDNALVDAICYMKKTKDVHFTVAALTESVDNDDI